MRIAALGLALAIFARTAAADSPTGVVVVGDNELRAGVADRVHAWLAPHGHTSATMP